MNQKHFDIIIVGGGVAGCLALNAIKFAHPNINILLIERNSSLGGNNTWYFCHDEIPESAWIWLKPLVSLHWDYYRVSFPEYERQLQTPTYSVKSTDLHLKTTAQHVTNILLNTEVIHANFLQDQNRFHLDITSSVDTSNNTLTCESLIFATGTADNQSSQAWHKFVGLEIELEYPHAVTAPTTIDACVSQIDGFRFFSVLPIGTNNLFIRDNYYSNHPVLKTERIQTEILNYADNRNWKIKSIIRSEQASLPLPLKQKKIKSSASRLDHALVSSEAPIALIGKCSPVEPTHIGFTFSNSVKQIESIVNSSNLTPKSMQKCLVKTNSNIQSYSGFLILLNNLMFNGMQSNMRYRLLQYLYRQPQELIDRVNSNCSNALDRFRILFGKLPVSVFKIIKIIRDRN